jgi:hypothetical protein
MTPNRRCCHVLTRPPGGADGGVILAPRTAAEGAVLGHFCWHLDAVLPLIALECMTIEHLMPVQAAAAAEKIVQLPFMMRAVEPADALSLLSIDDRMKAFIASEPAKNLILEATTSNPRRLKRYLNALLVLETLTGAISDKERLILSKVLFIQMRYPALYYEMLRDANIAHNLSEILSLTDLQQKMTVGQQPDVVKTLYADQGLRQFLARTQKIPCSSTDVERWIRLTNGNPLQV